MSILVALLGAPLLSVLIEKIAQPIAGWIENKVHEKAKVKDIELEMRGAIENGQVEYFILKYQEHLSDKMITRLRSVDRLRVLLNHVQQIVCWDIAHLPSLRKIVCKPRDVFIV